MHSVEENETTHLIEKENTSVHEKDSFNEEEERAKLIRQGSVTNAISNYTNAITGASMLSLPYILHCTGFLTGYIVMLCVLGISILSAHILNEASFYNHTGFRSYQECLEKRLGKAWKKVCEFIICIYITGISVAYLIVVAEFILPIVIVVVGRDDLFFTNKSFILLFLSIIFIFPFTLLREVKKLGFIAIIALLGIFYLGGFLTTQGTISLINGAVKAVEHTWFFQDDLFLGFYPQLFLALPMACFCFHCAILYFPISYELKYDRRGNRKKMDFVIVVSLILVFIIYSLIAIFGFLIFGDEVKDNVLSSFANNDIFANFARIVYGITIACSFPIQNYAGRLAFQSLFGRDTTRELGTFAYLTLDVVYFLVIVALAIFVPNISLVFSFLGSICPPFLMFLAPGALCIRVLTKKYAKYKFFWILLGICFILLGCTISVTGLFASVLKFIDGIQKGKYKF